MLSVMEEAQLQYILANAKVPEHSVPLMTVMSGADPLLCDDYLFFAKDDWLIAVGWPLASKYSDENFISALNKVQDMTGAARIYYAGAKLPAKFKKYITETDRFYVLSTRAAIPRQLRNPVLKAASRLIITENAAFTAAHRKLWAEFLGLQQSKMPARVKELYANTPEAMQSGKFRLLDAKLPNGDLAASLLLDYSCNNFCAYIIGAHSRKNYVAHATDALFAQMLVNAKEAGKRYIHLGLGVNPGILRFKRKWGAVPASFYVAAQWQNIAQKKPALEPDFRQTLARAILHAEPSDMRRRLQITPSRKPYAMLWRVRKNGKESWLGGTAHFFCHSFELSFRNLFNKVDNVVFEGPLDAAFMADVQRNGQSMAPNARSLLEQLTEPQLLALEKVVKGKSPFWSRELVRKSPKADLDIPYLLAHSRPWHAFFTLWTAFLENQGWHESVDMEAWRIANDMEKNVIGMENLEEQLESLNSLPEERVTRFFRDCKSWKKRAAMNEKAYLAGDLELMMGTSAEFPTRTEHIVSRRDQRFRERMRPWLEKGRTAVFVGTAHLVNLRQMLKEDGFTVEQAPYGIWPKIQLALRKRKRSEITW